MPSTEHERRDALPAGTALRDFTIRSVIGHGGFGIVYRAEHNELDLAVAIKEYLPVELAVREGATVQPRSGTDRPGFEDGLRRFRDEARTLIEFESHPSIVPCRDFFRANGTAYLVMAYEDGLSLAEVLASREAEGRPFTEADLLAVMVPVLDGLAHVHRAGVLHRDIKPSNILIRRRDERPVLIDFGAAKQAAAKFSKSQAPYTEGYAALEQVADTGKLGPWTDMYGAGAVMWRMVAGGNRPWEPPHPVRVELRSHAAVGEAEDPMPSAKELGRGRFPPKMLEAIDRCLRLQEQKRLQGSRELLEALRAASDLSSSAVPVESARRSAEPAVAVQQENGSRAAPAVPEPRAGRRRAGGLALAGLAVGLGLGLMLATWWSLGSEETERDQGLSRSASTASQASRDPGSEETVRDQGSDAASRTPSGDVKATVLDMEFVRIPAGRFRMGSPQDEAGRNDNEWLPDPPDPKYDPLPIHDRRPRGRSPEDEAFLNNDERQHEVRISEGFYLGRYEVTQGEWEAVMGTNPSVSSACGSPCPVTNVSWFDAQDFIRRLNERESGSGYRYRLPTEAEWEYAARSGTTGVLYGELDAIAWYEANSGDETHPVGLKQANGWGLYDMQGNVSEWTRDWYGKYPSGPVTDPQGPLSGSFRVVRGGSRRDGAGFIRSANRHYYAPGARLSNLGFRLVRTE